jgi:DNA repair protein RadC
MNVKLTEAQKIQILNSTDVAIVMQQILLRENKIRRNQEHFWVVGLNNKQKILFIELVSLGASNRVNVDPPDLFRMAIYKLATAVILVHNHPSGVAKPSDADMEFTKNMIVAGKLLRVDVLDHLIISDKIYTSFIDLGIMDKLIKAAKKILPTSAKPERELIAKETQMDMASKMLNKKEPLAKIIEFTGLTKKEVESLQGKTKKK